MCRSIGLAFDWNEYFDWLKGHIDRVEYDIQEYDLLLKELFKIEYRWHVRMDVNRHEDAIDLRSIFATDNGCAYVHDGSCCSVLEMLVALSIRCEVEIMAEPGNEDPSKLFWVMIHNLGLAMCTDDMFDRAYVMQQVNRWLDGDYRYNGEGGLFKIKGRHGDIRKKDAWSQMQLWLLEKGEYYGEV